LTAAFGQRVLRIATRRSALATWQARHVSERLVALHPGLAVELVEITTTGDRILDRPLALVGGKGLFVKEIEEALLRGEAELAVHSLKDLPGKLPEGLTLAAPPMREDPRDALVSRRGETVEALRRWARVGTSSLRRALQLRALRPDLAIVSVRGNVPTRVAKAVEPSSSQEADLDAVMLAAAGLRRLSLEHRISELLDAERFVPAICQGVLGLEYREEDKAVAALLAPLRHEDTAVAMEAERALLAALGASCTVPLGGHAMVSSSRVVLRAVVGNPDGGEIHRFEREGDRRAAARVGHELAEELLASPVAGVITAPVRAAFDATGLLV
jgi:hydroxymethylbilane synthase